jgi:hypothetical protein
MHSVLEKTCAWLKLLDGKTYIYVYKDQMKERKRLGIFHECGHFVLPWHCDFNYTCSEDDLESPTRRKGEREAFEFGSGLLMPVNSFREDILSLPTGISAIEELKKEYVASLEATAIWYASKHPGRVAMLMIEPAQREKSKDQNRTSKVNPQLTLPMVFPTISPDQTENKLHPLRVKYSVRSKQFPKFIKPGTSIDENNIIFHSWFYRQRIIEDIPASVFGSSEKWAYYAECLPLGHNGKMMLLLWFPENKLNFF